MPRKKLSTVNRRRAPMQPQKNDRPERQPELLKGWKSIADFLGQSVNVAQRWGRSGMPVKREGRNTVASPADLSNWLGRESGTAVPVHIAAEADTDLSADLKRSLSDAKAKPARKR